MSDESGGATANHIVIAGASFAGLSAAFTLRKRLGSEFRITVIDPATQFTFKPSLVDDALGHPALRSSFPLEPALNRRNIRFLQSHVRQVDPDNRRLDTDATQITYGRLLIATGGRPDPAAVPGTAGEFRASGFIVGLDSAEDVRIRIRKLSSTPGRVIVGATQGAGYISAMYELAFGIDTLLRRESTRDRVQLTFLTAEPFLGHLGFGQTAAKGKLESMFSRRDITFHTGAIIARARPGEIVLESGETIEAVQSFIMPPFTGDVDIWKSPNLTDERGFVPVDERYRHMRYPEIYAAGVASTFAHPITPLTQAAAPATGYLAMRMGKIAAQNIASSLGTDQVATRPLPRTLDIRVLDAGNGGLLLMSRGEHQLKNSAFSLPGSSARHLKHVIERYHVRGLRTGRI